jgi:hypothetical protein
LWVDPQQVIRVDMTRINIGRADHRYAGVVQRWWLPQAGLMH